MESGFDGPRGYHVTTAEVRAMKALRARGASLGEISRAIGRGYDTVRVHLGLEPEAIQRLPDEDARQIRAEYEGPGQPSTRALARKWGWSQRTIRKAIRHAGGTLRRKCHPRRLPLTAQQALALQESGMRPRDIAAQYGILEQTLSGMLSRAKRERARAGSL